MYTEFHQEIFSGTSDTFYNELFPESFVLYLDAIVANVVPCG